VRRGRRCGATRERTGEERERRGAGARPHTRAARTGKYTCAHARRPRAQAARSLALSEPRVRTRVPVAYAVERLAVHHAHDSRLHGRRRVRACVHVVAAREHDAAVNALPAGEGERVQVAQQQQPQRKDDGAGASQPAHAAPQIVGQPDAPLPAGGQQRVEHALPVAVGWLGHPPEVRHGHDRLELAHALPVGGEHREVRADRLDHAPPQAPPGQLAAPQRADDADERAVCRLRRGGRSDCRLTQQRLPRRRVRSPRRPMASGRLCGAVCG
jgi:hypothetical protein